MARKRSEAYHAKIARVRAQIIAYNASLSPEQRRLSAQRAGLAAAAKARARPKVRRIHISLKAELFAALENEARALGVSNGEALRRAVALWIQRAAAERRALALRRSMTGQPAKIVLHDWLPGKREKDRRRSEKEQGGGS